MDKHDLKEASLVWDLQDAETKKKMQRRANELLRLIELAKKSKQKALDVGDIDLADQLDAKIEEMQNLAANLDYYDQFDDENEEEAEDGPNGKSDNQDDPEEQSGNDGSEEESANKDSKEGTETSETEKDGPDMPHNNKNSKGGKTGKGQSDDPNKSEDDPNKPNDDPNKPGDDPNKPDDGPEDDPNGPEDDPNGPEDDPNGPEDDPNGPGGDPGDKKKKKGSKDDPGDEPGDEPDGPEDDPGDKKNKKDSKNDQGNDPKDKPKNGPNDNPEDDPEDDPKDDPDPIEDIFKMEPPRPSQSNGKKPKEPRKPSLEEIIQQLSRLEGPSLDGAMEALQDILNSDTNESLENNLNLTEAIKPITHMSEDEFDNYVNDALDLIEKGTKVTYTDLKDRKTKIQQLANDPAETKKLNNEDRDNKAKSDPERAIKASEREKRRYNNVGTIEQFELNFFRAINDQVEMVKQQLQTYDEINNEYEGENIIMKADVEKEIPEEDRPVINFYFDVSGSWVDHPDAIEIGKKAVATVKEFEDKGEVILNIYYFGDSISPYMGAVWGQGTTAWKEIANNIRDTEAKNVVIMTDCDIGYLATNYNIMADVSAEVDGCVWFIWSLYDYAGGSPWLKKHLVGHSGNLEYAFGSGGHAKAV